MPKKLKRKDYEKWVEEEYRPWYEAVTQPQPRSGDQPPPPPPPPPGDDGLPG